MKSSVSVILLILWVLAHFGVAAAQAATLDAVKARGELTCGADPHLAGFSVADGGGNWTGFDVDYCRAIAAAIFDDPTKVKFIALTAKERFAALQSGAIDVLAHDVPWTLSHETAHGLLFTAINYFDGQGFMVHRKLNIASVLELSGASVCVRKATVDERNLADFFQAHQMKYEAVTFATDAAAMQAYAEGKCDAFTSDAASLYARRVNLANPADHVILPEIISKDPFGLVVRQGDDQWFNLVKWVHFAMVDAEAAGISSQNVDDKLTSSDPETRRLLGADGDGLGLTKDWVFRIIKHVGNYGEVFERNLGDGSLMKIRRGLNALWSKGGLQYAPPLR